MTTTNQNTSKPYLGLRVSQTILDQLDVWAEHEASRIMEAAGGVEILLSRAEIARGILMKAINREMNDGTDLGKRMAEIASVGLARPEGSE